MTLFVLGNAAVDVVYNVPHLPRPGETLLAGRELRDLGGKGLNQAIVATRTGANVSFWSAVGDDAAGDMIRARLAEEGLDTRHLRTEPGTTDLSMIFVGPSGENAIVSTADKARGIDTAFVAPMVTAVGQDDLLLLQGNLTESVTRHSLIAAKESGARTAINPAPIDFDYANILPAADTVIVNEVENATLSGERDVSAGAKALIERGASAVVTTRGAAGALLATAETTHEVAAPRVEAIDTTGAGDVFCGVFAGALATGVPLIEACAWAVRAASIAATRRGTLRAFPSAAEIAACRAVKTLTAY